MREGETITNYELRITNYEFFVLLSSAQVFSMGTHLRRGFGAASSPSYHLGIFG